MFLWGSTIGGNVNNRSTNVDDFEAMADIVGIFFTHDEKTKTLIIDENESIINGNLASLNTWFKRISSE